MPFQPDVGFARTKYQANSGSQMLMSAIAIESNNFDCGSCLDEINAIERNVEQSDIEVMAMSASGITPDHIRRAHMAEQSFLLDLQ